MPDFSSKTSVYSSKPYLRTVFLSIFSKGTKILKYQILLKRKKYVTQNTGNRPLKILEKMEIVKKK